MKPASGSRNARLCSTPMLNRCSMPRMKIAQPSARISFQDDSRHQTVRRTGIHGAVARNPDRHLALGFVSLLMDVSSEMIHALLPVYLVTVLGTSTLAVGFIE